MTMRSNIVRLAKLEASGRLRSYQAWLPYPMAEWPDWALGQAIVTDLGGGLMRGAVLSDPAIRQRLGEDPDFRVRFDQDYPAASQ